MVAVILQRHRRHLPFLLVPNCACCRQELTLHLPDSALRATTRTLWVSAKIPSSSELPWSLLSPLPSMELESPLVLSSFFLFNFFFNAFTSFLLTL